LKTLLALLISLSCSAGADDFGAAKVVVFSKSSVSGGDAEKGAARDVVNQQGQKIAAAVKAGAPLVGNPGKDASERLSAIDSCDPQSADIGADPDAGGSITCGGDMYDVMTSGGGGTDRTANSGIIRYNRQSVLAREALYQSAFLFYRDLKQLDLSSRGAPGDPSGAGIEAKSSRNLLQLARESVKKATGKDDALLAMKVLALYGHDNRFNFLSTGGGSNSNSCRLKLLDAMKPNANSSLYLNGALGREYWEDDVARAAAVDKECRAAAAGLSAVERDMCGEYTSYQADYYHVVTSAFLNCRCLARGNSVVQDMTGGLQRNAYLWMAAKYKSDRFDEEIKAGLKSAGHTPAVDLLAKAWSEKGGLDMTGSWKLTCDSAKASVCVDRLQMDSWGWKGWCSNISGCSDAHVSAAKALIARYAFEINFRVDQHFMGVQVATFDLRCGR
jgi:hypothetical protein